MKLYDLISNLKIIGIKNFRNIDIDYLTCNSKEKLDNSIFFCLNGKENDGHNFASEAINNGSVCLVVERFLDLPVIQIIVENVRATMSYVSAVFFEIAKSKMKFIGITGTNGKTTTTFLIREILLKLGKKVGLIGTEGIFINSLMLPAMLTTPDPINLHKIIRDMEKNMCEYCVMEVSAHAIALNKIDGINYDVVGLSNITQDHLDFFLTMENYTKCKLMLLNSKHAKLAVVNGDIKQTKQIVKNSDIPIFKYGKDGNIKLLSLSTNMEGSNIIIEFNNKTYNIKTNLIGEYNVYNMLMAISVLVNLNINLNDIVKVINENNFIIPGRLNLLKLKTNFNVIIDYAHTPDGIANVLKALRNLPCSKIITVFGCGGDRDKTKRNEMGKIATKFSDYVIVTSDNPRTENPEMIIEDIVKGNESKNLICITNRKSAVEHALTMAKENDLIAILGKGAETYQEINGVKEDYSDYDVVDNYFNNKE